MNITIADIPDQGIMFASLEVAGKPVQYLSVTPLELIDYGDGRWEGNYVRVSIHLEVSDATRVTLGDHVTVGSFRRLHELLLGFQNGATGSGLFGTADEQLELTIEWREAMRDVRFAGRIPAFEFTELVDEPQSLRGGIYRVISFQFALEPNALSRPIAELKKLLDLIDAQQARSKGTSEG